MGPRQIPVECVNDHVKCFSAAWSTERGSLSSSGHSWAHGGKWWDPFPSLSWIWPGAFRAPPHQKERGVQPHSEQFSHSEQEIATTGRAEGQCLQKGQCLNGSKLSQTPSKRRFSPTHPHSAWKLSWPALRGWRHHPFVLCPQHRQAERLISRANVDM